MCIIVGGDVLGCIMSMMHGRLELMCLVFHVIVVRELRDGFTVCYGCVV